MLELLVSVRLLPSISVPEECHLQSDIVVRHSCKKSFCEDGSDPAIKPESLTRIKTWDLNEYFMGEFACAQLTWPNF